MTSVRIFVPLAATYHWPLHQLDIKNAFLNGIFDEVYMEQAPDFVAQENVRRFASWKVTLRPETVSKNWFCHFTSVIQEFGLCHAEKDYSVFWRIQHGKRILLVCMWMILWSQEMIRRGLIAWSTYRSTFRPMILDPLSTCYGPRRAFFCHRENMYLICFQRLGC